MSKASTKFNINTWVCAKYFESMKWFEKRLLNKDKSFTVVFPTKTIMFKPIGLTKWIFMIIFMFPTYKFNFYFKSPTIISYLFSDFFAFNCFSILHLYSQRIRYKINETLKPFIIKLFLFITCTKVERQ